MDTPTEKNKPILFWKREQNREEVEQVYGDRWVRWLYQHPIGSRLESLVLARPAFSKIYGAYQDTRLSARKVPGFIQNFKIPMEEYEDRPFTSFNDFFIRQFRPGVRRMETAPGKMPAPAEARYLGFSEVRPDQVVPVKGEWLSARALLNGSAKSKLQEAQKQLEGGPLMIARLCPVDYHRFHFPDDGRIVAHERVQGRLSSVNPVALAARGEIFATNERQVTLIETKNFGLVAYIEVGALCVGKIVQTHALEGTCRRGEEKGYFLFGASTVILMGCPGKWKPSEDILKNSANRRETFVKLGDQVAIAT